MTRLARLSAAERMALIEDFLTATLRGIDPPPYRQGPLAALPELPAGPTTTQVDAWLDLGELLHDPGLGEAMRRIRTRRPPQPHRPVPTPRRLSRSPTPGSIWWRPP
jgi:hypothetical protein